MGPAARAMLCKHHVCPVVVHSKCGIWVSHARHRFATPELVVPYTMELGGEFNGNLIGRNIEHREIRNLQYWSCGTNCRHKARGTCAQHFDRKALLGRG